MTDFEDRETFDRLEGDLAQASAVTAAFSAELSHLQTAMTWNTREANMLSRQLGSQLKIAFDSIVFEGGRASDALRGLAQSIVDNLYTAAMKPIQSAIGGALMGGFNTLASGLLPFANGGAFSQGRVMPFARGGVVSGPTTFPLRGGMGLMGEAGPEAILPLTRGADGRLGVQTQGAGGRPVQVVMNITTPDVQGFRRSQSQIAAELGRAIGRGQRNR